MKCDSPIMNIVLFRLQKKRTVQEKNGALDLMRIHILVICREDFLS